MKVIEQEIHSLKNSISEMWALVHQQLYNAGEAMPVSYTHLRAHET